MIYNLKEAFLFFDYTGEYRAWTRRLLFVNQLVLLPNMSTVCAAGPRHKAPIVCLF